METQKARLEHFIDAIGNSTREFERTIGVSNGTVRHATDSLSANLKEKISANFPQLNMEWLTSGTGEMFLSEESRNASVEAKLRAEIEELKDLIRRKDREIDGLYERIAELKGGSTAAAIQNVQAG